MSTLRKTHRRAEPRQGERCTLSKPARRTVLDRLLAINHQRYATEVAAGEPENSAKKGASGSKHKPKPNTESATLELL